MSEGGSQRNCFGVDVVVSYDADWGDMGMTKFTASANYNDYQIASVNIANANGTPLFDAESIYDFEHGQAKTRGIFTATHMRLEIISIFIMAT